MALEQWHGGWIWVLNFKWRCEDGSKLWYRTCTTLAPAPSTFPWAGSCNYMKLISRKLLYHVSTWFTCQVLEIRILFRKEEKYALREGKKTFLKESTLSSFDALPVTSWVPIQHSKYVMILFIIDRCLYSVPSTSKRFKRFSQTLCKPETTFIGSRNICRRFFRKLLIPHLLWHHMDIK